MLDWLANNVGSIFVFLILLAAVAGAVCVLRRDRKQGKSSCGVSCGGCSGCSGCPSRGRCSGGGRVH